MRRDGRTPTDVGPLDDIALIVERRHPQDAYGIVTETDIVYKVVAYGKDPKKVRVYQIMTKPCIAVNPDLGLDYVARLFADNGLLRAPVVQGELLGKFRR